jgi:membrane-associated phospholipid phosphatase
MIPDVYASDRNTRTKPLVSVVAVHFVGVVVLLLLGAPNVFVSLMISFLINMLVITIVTQTWKISIHTSGISGTIHHLGVGMLPFLALVFPVAWARVKLKAHSYSQVILGALLSPLLVNFQLFFLQNII